MPRNKEIKLEIKSDRLLLVEGKDEVNLFTALIKHCFSNEIDIQVIDAGGIYNILRKLKAIREIVRTRPNFQSIGVVRDADDNSENAFISICNNLKKAEYHPPQSHGTFSNNSPSVGVFIMPNGTSKGCIETLCWQSVKDLPAAKCVEQYLECLENNNTMNSKNKDKSFAHAYLASMQNPVARVGEGALQGAWKFDSPAFKELIKFIVHRRDTLRCPRPKLRSLMMPQNKEIKLEIKSDRLLLVEGKDEVNLFTALIKHCFSNEIDIQVIDAGGIYNILRNLKAIREIVRTRPNFQSIGVIRDADDNSENAFISICNNLEKAEYHPPQSHGTFSNNSPSVGVFIMPNGTSKGSIETLCWQSVKDLPAAKCVEQYLECLENNNTMNSKNKDKSFAHAYLASMQNPVARVGEGALQGAWKFDSPAFKELIKFIRDL